MYTIMVWLGPEKSRPFTMFLHAVIGIPLTSSLTWLEIIFRREDIEIVRF